MQHQEMQKLKVGDRVLWIEEKIPGTVTKLLTHGLVIDYDDGLSDQALSFDDSDFITLFRL
ncbi:MAG: hypothetical protein ABSA41_12470 [Terriglobia bacterium]|jgi:hypothetical protein